MTTPRKESFGVFGFVFMVLAFPARLVWQVWPGLGTATLFVIVMMLMWLSLFLADDWASRIGRGAQIVGAFLNSTVVLANGGFMPVAAGPDWKPGSVWIRLTADTRFPFLADIHATASIGDILLIGGFVLICLAPLFRKVAEWLTEQDSLSAHAAYR